MSVHIDKHVALARTLGLVVLLSAYVTIDLALSSLRSDADLAEARRALTAILTYEKLQPRGAERMEKALRDRQFFSLQEEWDVPGFETVTLDIRKANAINESQDNVVVSMTRKGRRRWSANLPLGYLYSNGEFQSVEPWEEGLNEMADSLGINVADPPSHTATYNELERQLLDRSIKVPGTDMEFSQRSAAWALVGSMVFFLIMTTHHARRALTEPASTLTEPWLLLDYREGLDALVGRIWVVLLLFMPSLAVSSLILFLASSIRASGSISSLTSDAVTFATCVGLLVTAGCCSIRTVSALTELRMRLRSADEERAAGPRTVSTSPQLKG